jgi:hypothetical protein
MPEPGPHDLPARKDEPEVAAADWLLRDDVPAAPLGRGSGSPVASQAAGVFDLAEPSQPESAPARRGGVRSEGTAGKPDTVAARPARQRLQQEPEAVVEEVWSRRAEWGPNLFVLAIWLFGLATFVYFGLGLGLYGLSFLALVLGGLVAAVLSYPILITLERPVRMTPEQAVRDYYAALSHHLPHYRRMWLLLSSSGRISWAYASFEGFKAYWKERLQKLRGAHAGPLTPLVFEVVEYRGDKSAGQSQVEAQFTVKVSVRGQRQAGPIATYPVEIGLVRGPDKMWYLDDGTLPDPDSAKQPG